MLFADSIERPVATVWAILFSLSRISVSLVKGDISDASFNSVPSKSKNIRCIGFSIAQGYGPKSGPIFKT